MIIFDVKKELFDSIKHRKTLKNGRLPNRYF